MNKIISSSLFFFFGMAAVAEAKAQLQYKDFLDSTKNFTAPFDNQSAWENGVESNDINGKILTLAALSVVDLKQSEEAGFKKPGTSYQEKNVVLGTDPSLSKMAAFGLIGVGTVYIAEKLLQNHPGLQQVLIDSVLSTEAYNVESNTRLVQVGYGKTRAAIPIIITVRW